MAVCGIAVTKGNRPIEPGCVEEMVSTLAMGQEDRRVHCSAPLASFGAVSASATSSVFCSDRVMVTCDVNLYNTQELGESISTLSPSATTAVLIATLYLQYGGSFLEKLRGAFSLAVWDQESCTLFLARDRFGVKPLCYTALGSEIIFASHPRGIFATRRLTRQPHFPAIVNFLNYHVVPAPDTAFEGIKKVNPGEFLIWKAGEAGTKRYWDLQYTEDARGPVRKLASDLLSRMEDAVRVTSTGLTPERTGCFLSGGTDSSTVVGLLGRITCRPTNAFSIGFTESRFNELEYAHLAAQHFQVRYFESILRPEDAYEAIPKIVDAYDEPFANASVIPTYWCAKLAKEHGMQAMLAGDGGDELFGGNERYRTHQIFQLYQRIPGPLRKLVEPVVFASPAIGLFGKAQRYIRRSNTPNPERYCGSRLFQMFPANHVLGPAMPHVNGDVLAVMRRYYDAAPAQSEMNRLLYVDIKMTLGDEDLPKVTRTAELAGIEVRFPLLDHRLAEFSGRLHASLKVHRLEKRYLFKQATRALLPHEILRKKKHGFGLPIGFWLKTDPKLRSMSRDVLLDPKTYQRGYFRRPFIELLMANMEQDTTPYFGDLLWSFFMLELWHRRHLEGAVR